MAQHNGTVFLEMVAVADDAVAICNQPLKHGLALDERQCAEVVAVQIKQVEQVEDEAVAAAFAEIGLQG